MPILFLISQLLCALAFATKEREPIKVLLEIPGSFSVPPQISSNDGIETRVWYLRGETEKNFTQLIQFVSLPITSGETVAQQAEHSKKNFKTIGCQVAALKDRSTEILGSGKNHTGSMTREKILRFDCPKTGLKGVYRFIEGDARYGGGIYTVSYAVRKGAPKSLTLDKMEERLTAMTVVIERDYTLPKK